MAKKIMLDAGHGLPTSGKRTPNGNKGVFQEFTLNQAVIDSIVKNLADYEVEISYSHDTTGMIDVPLTTRVKRINDFNPDLFISIHHNAFHAVWGDHKGIEVYYHTYGTAEDKKVAGLLAPAISKKTSLLNRGVKTASYEVLTCKATAVLCEGGFMDSTIDYPIITSKEGQQGYARAVSDVIITYLDLKKKPIISTPDPSAKVIYRVVTGSYTTRINADIQSEKLKKAGIETFIMISKIEKITYYRVIAGSYTNKINAETQKNKLIQKGFDAFLLTEKL